MLVLVVNGCHQRDQPIVALFGRHMMHRSEVDDIQPFGFV